MMRRLLQRDEYQLAAEFIDNHWSRNHVYTRDKELFDWSFGACPGWENEEAYSFFIAETEGQVVSILGFQPYYLNVYGNRYLSSWLSNWKTIDGFTGGPVGVQLLLEVRRMNYYALVSQGISDYTVRMYKSIRGKTVEGTPRWVAILPGQQDAFADLVKHSGASLFDEQRMELSHHLHISKPPAADTTGVQMGLSDPEKWDRTIWSVFAGSLIGGERTAAYIDWRYCRHPRFDYQVAWIEEGPHVGFTVWRIEVIHEQVGEELRPLVPFARCVEFLASDQHTANRLLALLIQKAAEEEAIAIDWYGHLGRTGTQLAKGGMRLVDDLPNGHSIPCRFQPLDSLGGALRGAMLVEQAIPDYPFSPDCPWYTSRSDSDQDRPN